MNIILWLLFTAFFAVGASAQTVDTARVTFHVNVAATVTAVPDVSGTAITKTVAANTDVVIAFPLSATTGVSLDAARREADAPAVVGNHAGKIALSLPAKPYKNAEISLHSINGKRILNAKAFASESVKDISRRDVTAGVYLLSVKGADGDAYSTRFTHGGGGLDIRVTFGGEERSPRPRLAKEAALGDWAVKVTAAGYRDSAYTFRPISGANPKQNITLVSAAPPAVMGTYTNPILNADVPDPCLIRVDSSYYLVSTTMHLMPGAPIMKSKDLVNWETVSYVFDRLTDSQKYDMTGGTVYGRGQWASSIRYHKGTFYLYFAPNEGGTAGRGYIYKTTNPETEPWTLHSRIDHFHDASLFFDDDGRVYMFHGTGGLRELNADLSGVKSGGINKTILERGADDPDLLEGTHVLKKDGYYYVFMISWATSISGSIRREVCYRATDITGPYVKKVILEAPFENYGGVGQGFIVDSPEGDWYGFIFQDRGGIGRVPMLMPCYWIDNWPMLGSTDGKTLSKTYTKILRPGAYDKGIVGSDDFSGGTLSRYWQWNHNPVNASWSLTERPGYLRLKTARVVGNLYAAMNTITQRMEGSKSTGTISLDLTNMKDGDVAGFSAFNGHSGTLSVKMDGTQKTLAMSTDTVHFDDNGGNKAISRVGTQQRGTSVAINQNTLYLRIECDFTSRQDLAKFYYSLDNKTWTQIGINYKMTFDYTRLFMGTKFAIFNYATKSLGGYVDVDYFDYTRIP